ncbi:MAG: phosphate ABC transporter permease subunit PstC [Planctomycetaceae bacterium]
MANSSRQIDFGNSPRRIHEKLIHLVLLGCALASILTTIGIILVLLNDSVFTFGPSKAFFQRISLQQFLLDTDWNPSTGHFGILPLLSGTLMVASIACSIGVPLGLGAAIYLSEYAAPRERSVVKPVLELLAGIPTVVFGYFGLAFITPYVLQPLFQRLFGIEVSIYNVASAGIVVGIMITPTVASLSEDVLRAVPTSLRDAAYALGATKLDVSVRIVVPAALSGILAAILLAFARAVGETMAVTICCGSLVQLSANPFESMQTMTAFMVSQTSGEDSANSIEFKSIYAVGLALFVITLTINLISQYILSRFREVYE